MTDISALEAYAGQLSEAAALASASAQTQKAIVNGDALTDVPTESGPVPTLAKQAVMAQDKVTAALEEVASQLAGSMTFTTTAKGILATQPGGLFGVLSPSNKEYVLIYENVAGVAVPTGKSYPSADLVEQVAVNTEGVEQNLNPSVVFSVADGNDYSPLSINDQGVADIPDLQVGSMKTKTVGVEELYSVAFMDEAGNMAFALDRNGKQVVGGPASVAVTEWKELAIGSDDSIVHIGDSYTASHYALKDKAYISQLSALSPYRHINYGVSGNDLLDMQYRIVNGTAIDGRLFSDMKAKYAFIASLTNDSAFRGADKSFYAENLGRLIDTVRAYGVEPVVVTEFPATSIEHALLARVAEEYGCHFIDCTSLDAEVGGLQLGPFHQGHPGTRTSGVFWLAMLDFIDRMPKPERAVKIYRRRPTFAVSAAADLLYKGRVDRQNKWKELTVFHYSLTPEAQFEELDQLSGTSWTARTDEYLQLAAGSPVAFTDYTLLEITLPGSAVTLEGVEIDLPVQGGTPTVYTRNYLDVAASMPGKIQGSGPTNPTYLSKWDKPRGAWRSLGLHTGTVVIPAVDLAKCMTGNTLVLMLTGAFSLTGLKVRYKGRERLPNLPPVKQRRPNLGSNLLTQPLCGTTGQLAGWTTTGAPAVIVPIDLYNAPRKPGLTTPVDGACVISASDTIGQTVTLPAENGKARRYRVEVWARYFPKAFLNPALYPTLATAQIIDRIALPAAAPITTDTSDLRTLKCEMWTGTNYPNPAGGAEFYDFAALQWRPVTFEYEAVPYRTGTQLSFRLSCPDGEIQIGKTQVWEI